MNKLIDKLWKEHAEFGCMTESAFAKALEEYEQMQTCGKCGHSKSRIGCVKCLLTNEIKASNWYCPNFKPKESDDNEM